MALFLRALLVTLVGSISTTSIAQSPTEQGIAWAVDLASRYTLTPNITYQIADGFDAKLDVIAPRDKTSKVPVVLYIHGGGWVGGDKNAMFFRLIPYLQMGMGVVNVEYRLGRIALAPAAVEDTRCALRWLLRNGDDHGFDTSKIVVIGPSAGGHLALTTGMLRAGDGLDNRCPGNPAEGTRANAVPREMRVAAIINWFGITDVGDLIEGDNAKIYAQAWLGSQPNWRNIADRVSPLNLVHAEQAPVLTLHGDADNIVPYSHAVRLHKRLQRKGVKNRLHTIAGGGHGNFSEEEYAEAHQLIYQFLIEQGVLTRLTSEGAS